MLHNVISLLTFPHCKGNQSELTLCKLILKYCVGDITTYSPSVGRCNWCFELQRIPCLCFYRKAELGLPAPEHIFLGVPLHICRT